jgi:hypothetical protein
VTVPSSNERLERWDARYVSEKQFPIMNRMAIYDDVVAYQDWRGGEVFGIEIYNQMIADMQRNFFEMLWTKAIPTDDLTGKKK